MRVLAMVLLLALGTVSAVSSVATFFVAWTGASGRVEPSEDEIDTEAVFRHAVFKYER